MDTPLFNGPTMPADFPTGSFEARHKKLAASRGKPGHSHFIDSWNPVSYRFMALAEYDERFTTAINAHGPGPGSLFVISKSATYLGSL